MGIDDKIGNASEEAAGKLKEGAGRATDDEQLEAEGRGRPDQREREAGRRGDQGRRQELTGPAQGTAG